MIVQPAADLTSTCRSRGGRSSNQNAVDTIVAWPAWSPDLTPLNFFLWDCKKEKVYQTEIASREELIAKINTAAMEIYQHGLDNAQREVRRRAETCVHARGDILSICSRQLTISLPSLKQTGPLDVESNGNRYGPGFLSHHMSLICEARFYNSSKNATTFTSDEQICSTYGESRVLVGRSEAKRLLERQKHRWEDSIKMDLKEVGYDARDWFDLAQDRDQLLMNEAGDIQECYGPNFLAFALRLRESPEKPQPGNSTRPGIEPGSFA
ncbi:hypothetical protein ANN_10381 [Periplaneta americana]|uniref:Uncharacterized protein n=1 Tax=Periplaneta americana TaxID=6978 RepID=A0ABQ8TSR2_PERAM|nr:hypothetical protein ANN_10381 [Periplaneta americana]